MVIRWGSASDNGGGTNGGRDAIHAGKSVETELRVSEHVGDHYFWEASERKSMHAEVEALHDCPDRTLNFANVTASSDDGAKFFANAFKFIGVGIDITDSESTGTV